MKKLSRDCVAIPPALVAPTPGARYASLRKAEKDAIRAALLLMQLDRCAYCDRPTGTAGSDGHIEHFRCQAAHPHLQLDWHNLFWSCNDRTTCGTYKDECSHVSGPMRQFIPEHILDPALDDPAGYLCFVSDGRVRVREGLAQDQITRAEETLRVFQLDASPCLRELRKDSVQALVRAVEAMASAGPDSLRKYVDSELAVASTRPFSLAIVQFLESVRPS